MILKRSSWRLVLLHIYMPCTKSVWNLKIFSLSSLKVFCTPAWLRRKNHQSQASLRFKFKLRSISSTTVLWVNPFLVDGTFWKTCPAAAAALHTTSSDPSCFNLNPIFPRFSQLLHLWSDFPSALIRPPESCCIIYY